VLEDRHAWAVGEEFAHEPERRIDVDDVVVGELLAVQLLDGREETPVECGLLMRVLAVAQVLRLVQREVERLAERRFRAAGARAEVVGDGAVEARRGLEGATAIS
jgi:hypothetical protein